MVCKQTLFTTKNSLKCQHVFTYYGTFISKIISRYNSTARARGMTYYIMSGKTDQFIFIQSTQISSFIFKLKANISDYELLTGLKIKLLKYCNVNILDVNPKSLNVQIYLAFTKIYLITLEHLRLIISVESEYLQRQTFNKKRKRYK